MNEPTFEWKERFKIIHEMEATGEKNGAEAFSDINSTIFSVILGFMAFKKCEQEGEKHTNFPPLTRSLKFSIESRRLLPSLPTPKLVFMLPEKAFLHGNSVMKSERIFERHTKCHK